ncbi:MAG: hypothetical protein JWN56_347 [Sphingobacteriales bacterium]|nr:hypothetical protein [Sphingobacteriales bacterium]
MIGLNRCVNDGSDILFGSGGKLCGRPKKDITDSVLKRPNLYYCGSELLIISFSSLEYKELVINNSAFSFQAKPAFIIPLDNEKDTQLRFALGLNYQKLFSKASISNYPLNTLNQEDMAYKNAESDFRFNIHKKDANLPAYKLRNVRAYIVAHLGR